MGKKVNTRETKGIVLAGGTGSRLYPITRAISKQLIPIYDKPLIYYPISVLMLSGVRQIAIITTPEQKNAFQNLLGDGSRFGIELDYIIQRKPEGIAQGLILAEEFIDGKNVCMILGDNIFWGNQLPSIVRRSLNTNSGATIFGYKVKDPERFGVIEFDQNHKVLSIEEKPKNPKSSYAATGLYIYDSRAVPFAKTLEPSARGELEITDLNNLYLKEGCLSVDLLGRGFAWMDTGTNDSLFEATKFVEAIQNRQGFKIACLEEIALNNLWLKRADIVSRGDPKNSYEEYIFQIASGVL